MAVADAFAALVQKIRECGYALFEPVYCRLLVWLRWVLSR